MTVRNYIKAIPPAGNAGSIRTGCEPDADMWRLVLCIAQQGWLPRFFEGGKGWDIRAALEAVAVRCGAAAAATDKGNGMGMAPVWVVHSEGDTMVCIISPYLTYLTYRLSTDTTSISTSYT